MADRAIDEKRLRKLLAEGKSQRHMAEELGIPRTTLQRMIKSLDASAPASKAPVPVPAMPFAGSPVVDTGTLSPAELDAVRSDFWEMMTWWRDRKMRLAQKHVPRETVRATYHVERRFVELIRHEAESEGVNIAEVVNRAFGAYFEKRTR